ncbi:threonine ammonia-lyase [Chelatococcus sp. SYSU_G07232]|uniref:Threonine ammonia-lyase n=1 Tax=Chelatococcus albus TaxID=3047466 RepID=A0ABT7AC52_9HYPH|nr:threonine ammonia-lyase [Chelatococcus sp. SYSU_G07232]MDJ1156943.1 threonine ammonia-lyase [Chelatococcus sp. SYSU_G07232]
MSPLAISFDDVLAAADIVAGQVLRTPLMPAPRLSALTGARVFVKHENMQVTGSFKERGATVKLTGLTEDERRRGTIAMSAGNHAQAVAYHAKRLGIPATIVMPETTPLVKVENTRAHGARVVLFGETLYESAAHAREIAEAEGLVFVHPYDDPAVMAGQGTIALEMLADEPDLDVLVVPIGGGGLCSGIATGAKGVKPGIEIIGVEAALYPSFHNAITGEDKPIGGPTLAEGIAVKTVGTLTLPIVRSLVSDILLVDEAEIEHAVYAYATLQRTMAEGAGAAGLAAMFSEPERFRGRTVGLVLCGGNIDARLLASVMVRELEREDRIISFRITSSDRPGLLGRITSRLGELGANILEVSHGRLFLDVPAKGVTIDLTVETRDADHTRAVLEALTADGLAPQRIDARGLSETAF